MTKKKDAKADEIKDLKEIIKQREAYIVSLQKKIAELEIDIDGLIGERDALEDEIEELRDELEGTG